MSRFAYTGTVQEQDGDTRWGQKFFLWKFGARTESFTWSPNTKSKDSCRSYNPPLKLLGPASTRTALSGPFPTAFSNWSDLPLSCHNCQLSAGNPEKYPCIICPTGGWDQPEEHVEKLLLFVLQFHSQSDYNVQTQHVSEHTLMEMEVGQ